MLFSEFGDMQFSKLRFYSMGIVAQNKALGSKMIEVTPVEELPMLDGEINAALTTNTSSGTDANGSAYNASAASAASIQATWLSLSVSNRLTAPDVRRGEAVMILQFADSTEKYYWMTLKDDISLRRLETVVWGISASKNENDPVDHDHIYYVEFSTHTKTVTLHTCKADGEPYAYTMQLNTKDGTFTLTDDIGNYLHLNSGQNQWEIKNASGSHFDMLQENLTVTIPDTTLFKTKDFKIQASNTFDVDATNTINMRTTNFSTTARSAAVVHGNNATMSADAAAIVTGSASATLSGPTCTVSGQSLSVVGGGASMGMTGGAMSMQVPGAATIQSSHTVIL